MWPGCLFSMLLLILIHQRSTFGFEIDFRILMWAIAQNTPRIFEERMKIEIEVDIGREITERGE